MLHHDPKYERHLLVHGPAAVAEWLVPAGYVMVDRIERKRGGKESFARTEETLSFSTISSKSASRTRPSLILCPRTLTSILPVLELCPRNITASMSTTVHVAGISHQTSEKEVRDFFSFCGKITSLSVTPSSDAADATKSASVTFEKETAAKTALLLDNTQLGSSQVHVTAASSIGDIAAKAGAAVSSDNEDLSQEDKPRSRIVAEYLAHGYVLGDNVLQRAIQLDNQHGYSNRFTSALANFDNKTKATDRAKSIDQSYGVTNTAMGAWSGLNSYFEKALSTPTGQKVRDFYVQGDRQVRDIHNEARRLADLKAGKTSNEPEQVSGTDKTVCKCGGAEGACPCAPGHCACSNCAKSTDSAVSEVREAQQAASEKV